VIRKIIKQDIVSEINKTVNKAIKQTLFEENKAKKK